MTKTTKIIKVKQAEPKPLNEPQPFTRFEWKLDLIKQGKLKVGG